MPWWMWSVWLVFMLVALLARCVLMVLNSDARTRLKIVLWLATLTILYRWIAPHVPPL
jgi:hypothetical protein